MKVFLIASTFCARRQIDYANIFVALLNFELSHFRNKSNKSYKKCSLRAILVRTSSSLKL